MRQVRPLVAEFLGTFLLVLIGCGGAAVSILSGIPSGARGPLAFGLAVAAVVYLFGPVSGAHVNPAVSLGLAAGGSFQKTAVAGYVLAQLSGAVAGAALLHEVLRGPATLGLTVPNVSALSAVSIEAGLTATLVAVIFVVVTAPRSRRWGGAVIGMTVALEAWWGGRLTGASMNPARSLGPALVSGRLGHVWIYLVGPAVGGLMAAGLHAGAAALSRGRWHAPWPRALAGARGRR